MAKAQLHEMHCDPPACISHIMTTLACVGKRFGDAGLQDIPIESEVVASGSIYGVINGHHYNQSIRSHKLLSEALQKLSLQSFSDSLSEEKAQEYQNVMMQLHTTYPRADFKRLVQEERFDALLEAYKNPRKEFPVVQLLLSGAPTST